MGQKEQKYKIKCYDENHKIEDLEEIINKESKEGWEVISLSEGKHFTTIIFFNMNWAVDKKI